MSETVGCNKRSALHRYPSDPRRSVPYRLRPYCTPAWPSPGLAANGVHLSNVIPAPLARAAGERDQAGTHAPRSLLPQRTIRATLPRGARTSGMACLQVDWVPAWSRSGPSGPSGAGMTLVE